MHWNAPGGLTTFCDPSSWNAKSVMIQRSSKVSYSTIGSPKLFVSHRLPKFPWLMNVLNVNAATPSPVSLSKMPIEVFTVSMK